MPATQCQFPFALLRTLKVGEKEEEVEEWGAGEREGGEERGRESNGLEERAQGSRGLALPSHLDSTGSQRRWLGHSSDLSSLLPTPYPSCGMY